MLAEDLGAGMLHVASCGEQRDAAPSCDYRETFDRGRRWLTLELGTVAAPAVVAFLASDEARCITGETLRVDGGALAHLPTYADSQ